MENNETLSLTKFRIEELARPLVSIVAKFYENPDNEAKFQKWLKSQKGVVKNAK